MDGEQNMRKSESEEKPGREGRRAGSRHLSLQPPLKGSGGRPFSLAHSLAPAVLGSRVAGHRACTGSAAADMQRVPPNLQNVFQLLSAERGAHLKLASSR